jgi:peroxiredoxin
VKKKFKIIIPLVFAVFIAFMGYKIYARLQQKQQIAENIKSLPAFYFYNMQDSIFTDADLQQNKAVLIIHFHPDCEHCRYEAELISKHINEFKPYRLLLISYAEKDKIKAFAQKYKLYDINNITFLQDKDMVFNNIFGKGGIPNTFIYDKTGKLVKHFKGEVKPETLLKYLKND